MELLTLTFHYELFSELSHYFPKYLQYIAFPPIPVLLHSPSVVSLFNVSNSIKCVVISPCVFSLNFLMTNDGGSPFHVPTCYSNIFIGKVPVQSFCRFLR